MSVTLALSSMQRVANAGIALAHSTRDKSCCFTLSATSDTQAIWRSSWLRCSWFSLRYRIVREDVGKFLTHDCTYWTAKVKYEFTHS